jgi:hypothetical protein
MARASEALRQAFAHEGLGKQFQEELAKLSQQDGMRDLKELKVL